MHQPLPVTTKRAYHLDSPGKRGGGAQQHGCNQSAVLGKRAVGSTAPAIFPGHPHSLAQIRLETEFTRQRFLALHLVQQAPDWHVENHREVRIEQRKVSVEDADARFNRVGGIDVRRRAANWTNGWLAWLLQRRTKATAPGASPKFAVTPKLG